MNKIKINIWNRAFELDVVYDCYEGEEVLESQKHALKVFIDSEEEILKSLEEVKKYVINDSELDSIDDIFEYVIPKKIYIPRDEKHSQAAIMCYYRFDDEHGMAVVFENGKFKEVGSEDIVL